MATRTCSECGIEFHVNSERKEFNRYFKNQLDYDDDYDNEDRPMCAQCAIADAEWLMECGRDAVDPDGNHLDDEDYW